LALAGARSRRGPSRHESPVILATGVAFLSEISQRREFEILNTRKDSIDVKVVREGHIRSLPIEDIVVANLVILERATSSRRRSHRVKASELLVDQSLMTAIGSSAELVRPVADETSEGPEQPGCVYRGTQIVDGTGHMIVTACDSTYLGEIARRLRRLPTTPTPKSAA